jgi:hypothetical protein
MSGTLVTAIGCHPGVAATDPARHVGISSIVTPLTRPFINTAAMGAWPTLQAATGKVTPGGYYGPLGFGGIRGPSGQASRAAGRKSGACPTALGCFRRHDRDGEYLSHRLPLAILGAPRHEASPARLLPAPRHLSPLSTHSIPPHSVPCARIRDRRNVAGDRKTCSLGARNRRCTIWVGSNNCSFENANKGRF